MRFFVRALSAAVLAAILAGGAAPAGATGVEIARNEAENNAKSPAGKRYEGTLLGKVFDWLRPAVEKCAKDAPPEERISFDALIRVGADGKARGGPVRARYGGREVRRADVPGPDVSEAAGALVVGQARGKNEVIDSAVVGDGRFASASDGSL